MPTCSSRYTPLSRRRAGRLHVAGLGAMAAWLSRCVERARQRRALARLDDRLLRDIGLCRLDTERETRRPFWRS